MRPFKPHPLTQVACILASSCLAFSVWAQSGSNKVKPTPATPTPTTQTASALTPYTENAQRGGVNTCLNRINQVTSFVIGNNRHQGIMQLPPTAKVNQALVTNTIAVDVGNVTSMVSTNFAPAANNTDCSGSYEAVTYWNTSCTQVAKTNFNTFQATQSLLQRVAVLEGSGAKVFLMPAGTGCISIKKEVLY